jgi:hypothetical protein
MPEMENLHDVLIGSDEVNDPIAAPKNQNLLNSRIRGVSKISAGASFGAVAQ